MVLFHNDMCSLLPPAYADYESGGYSPKLLKQLDVEEVSMYVHLCYEKGLNVQDNQLSVNVMCCTGFNELSS